MHLTTREFQRLVLRALQELPPQIDNALENVAILVEDWPGEDLLEGADAEEKHHLFGVYSGVSMLDREGGMPLLPDTITLFQRPIESACTTRNEVIREVRTTVLHEVGHYLGLSEEDLERLGYG